MVVVSSWRGTGSFRPVLSAQVAAPRDVVVASLAASLRRRRLKITYPGEDGFRLTYRSWLDVLGWLELDFFSFTRLRLTAVAHEGGTHVSIALEDDGALRASKPVTFSLGVAFSDLERQGYAVTMGTWQQPD